MSYKKRPFYEAMHKMELAMELTGKSANTIRKMMARKNWGLAETIRFYIRRNR